MNYIVRWLSNEEQYNVKEGLVLAKVVLLPMYTKVIKCIKMADYVDIVKDINKLIEKNHKYIRISDYEGIVIRKNNDF